MLVDQAVMMADTCQQFQFLTYPPKPRYHVTMFHPFTPKTRAGIKWASDVRYREEFISIILDVVQWLRRRWVHNLNPGGMNGNYLQNWLVYGIVWQITILNVFFCYLYINFQNVHNVIRHAFCIFSTVSCHPPSQRLFREGRCWAAKCWGDWPN